MPQKYTRHRVIFPKDGTPIFFRVPITKKLVRMKNIYGKEKNYKTKMVTASGLHDAPMAGGESFLEQAEAFHVVLELKMAPNGIMNIYGIL